MNCWGLYKKYRRRLSQKTIIRRPDTQFCWKKRKLFSESTGIFKNTDTCRRLLIRLKSNVHNHTVIVTWPYIVIMYVSLITHKADQLLQKYFSSCRKYECLPNLHTVRRYAQKVKQLINTIYNPPITAYYPLIFTENSTFHSCTPSQATWTSVCASAATTAARKLVPFEICAGRSASAFTYSTTLAFLSENYVVIHSR